MYTLSPETIKYADALAVEKYNIPDIQLMKNAAKSCFDYICARISKDDNVLILCGKGNNGGDGYEIAHLLKNGGYFVRVINVFNCLPVTETSKEVFDGCKNAKVDILPFSSWQEELKKADVVIDALFGVGFYGCISTDSDIGKMLSLCNECQVKRIAIDTPSGINSADGRVEDVAFRADFTITMAYIKTGMISYPAREYCGDILVADIGYPAPLCEEIKKDALIPDDEYVKSAIPTRKPNTHKGSYGRLLMYCASENMTGAGVLAAKAALRSGVGLLNIARNEKTIRILQNHLIEPIFSCIDENDKCGQVLSLAEKATAVLIGCGLGTHEIDKDALLSLIKNAKCNLIIDADGINLLSENTLILKEADKTPILTPHPLEFARLSGKTISEVQQNRINLARDFAKEHGCVLVLKGASTVIASPDGRIAVNTSGNPGLSKGGSGDVLAGLIASFTAQGISPFDSAVLGVYLHGKAADNLSKTVSEYGLLPSDLPMEIARMLP